MSLDIWFVEDAYRAINSARVAGKKAQEEMTRCDLIPAEVGAYWRGYHAALATIAAAFGIVEGTDRGHVLMTLSDVLEMDGPLPEGYYVRRLGR